MALPLVATAAANTRDLGPGLMFTKIRGGDSRINVLELDPAAGPRLQAALSNGRVRGREPLAGIARRTGALAAVNGGFFASAGASNGDPVGALVVRGRLVSETVDGRPSLIVYRDRARRARIARLGFEGSFTAGGKTRELDGVNRPAGFIPGCGGRGGDRPTERPDPNVMCTDRSELVLMTRDFGRRTPAKAGAVEAVIRDGKVESVGQGGSTRIPRGTKVLTGTGSAARFLTRRAQLGEPVEVSAQLTRKGTPIVLGEVQTIVSGDPLLLRRGRRPTIGPSPRRARTLVGVKEDGRILLVTIDGGAGSAGATLRASARRMRDLGARDALALDGGGSTTMTISERTVNMPSDGTPRGISDALVVAP